MHIYQSQMWTHGIIIIISQSVYGMPTGLGRAGPGIAMLDTPVTGSHLYITAKHEHPSDGQAGRKVDMQVDRQAGTQPCRIAADSSTFR